MQKFKSKEEALERIKKNNEGPVYSDDRIDYVYVDVCDLTIDGEVYRVPKSIGELIFEVIRDPKKKSDMVSIGNIRVRTYKIEKIVFKQEKFTSLNNWGRKIILQEQPDLLSEWEDNFSPHLKELLKEIKGGISGPLKALPKGTTA